VETHSLFFESELDREKFSKMEEFRKVIGGLLAALSESLSEDVKEGLISLLEDVEVFIMESGDVKYVKRVELK
jgi:hypothetical protein